MDDSASLLFARLLPLTLLIAFGFIAGRWQGLESRHLAGPMIYLLTPVVIFKAGLGVPRSALLLGLPLMVWCLCAVVSLSFYQLGRRWLQDSRANILAMGVVCSNTGYLGIPLALLLLGEAHLGIYVVVMLGVTLYENTLAFYLAAAGRHPPRQALQMVLRLPALYAFAAGVAAQSLGWSIPSIWMPVVDAVQGAYVVLGMMMIGLGIARFRLESVSPLFLGLLLAGKFVAWPALALLVVTVDAHWQGWLDAPARSALLLVSLLPISVSTQVFASLLNLHAQRVATAVLISTVLALLILPAGAAWFGIGR